MSSLEERGVDLRRDDDVLALAVRLLKLQIPRLLFHTVDLDGRIGIGRLASHSTEALVFRCTVHGFRGRR